MSDRTLEQEHQRRIDLISSLGDELTVELHIRYGHCPMTVVDAEGEEEPCGKTTTHWNFSAVCEFPATLAPTCHRHDNEAGNLIVEMLTRKITMERM